MRRSLLAFALILLSAASLIAGNKTKPITTRGFICAISSPTEFSIDDYDVVSDDQTKLNVVVNKSREEIYKFSIDRLKEGDQVEVTGQLNPDTGEVHASEVKLLPSELADGKVGGTVLLERRPSLQHGAEGWSGTIDADGRHLIVKPTTKITFAPEPSKSKTPATQPLLTSPDQVGPNVFMSYDGSRAADASVLAEELMFFRNETEPEEQKIRDADEPKITDPDYANAKAGELTLKSLGKLAIVPSKLLQERASAIGMSLVPQFQKDLPDSDPTKIHFRFYVVDGLKYSAGCSLNGLILVSRNLILHVENDAQLAAVLAREIAKVVEEQEYRMRNRREFANVVGWGTSIASFLPIVGLPSAAFGITNSLVWDRYVRSLTQQTARVALDYLHGAGYDPREANKAFEALSKKSKDKPNFSRAERSGYNVIRLETAKQLREAFKGADFATDKTNDSGYKELIDEAKKFGSKK